MPPSAGSVLVAGTLGVDLGTLILVGVPTAFIAMAVAGVAWGRNVGGRFFVEVPEHVAAAEEEGDQKEAPSFGMVLAIVLTPLCLILLGTLSSYIPIPKQVADVLSFIGKPFVALTLATLVAMYLLGTRRGYTGAELKALLDRSLKPVGMILLVIACGGVIRWMLQDCGLGQVIGPVLESSPLPLVVVGFLIAVLVRASVGSSIVAMTMASGIEDNERPGRFRREERSRRPRRQAAAPLRQVPQDQPRDGPAAPRLWLDRARPGQAPGDHRVHLR